jgi:hypothetical protein
VKANEWKFDRYIPDKEDVEALDKSLTELFQVHEQRHVVMNPSEERVYFFNAGFYRGIKWVMDRYGIATLCR